MERALWGTVWLNTLHSHWCQSSSWFSQGCKFPVFAEFLRVRFKFFSYFGTKAKQSVSVQFAEVVSDELTKRCEQTAHFAVISRWTGQSFQFL